MGACISSCIGSGCSVVCCGFGSSCLAMGKKATRVFYAILFCLGMGIAWIMKDYAKPMMKSVEHHSFHHVKEPDSDSWYGAQAAMRVSIGLFFFHTLIGLCVLGVHRKADFRGAIHTSGWFLKVPLWIGLMMVPFAFPNHVVEGFVQFFRLGSAFFILVQSDSLIEFGYEWNERWINKDKQRWLIALLVISIFLFLVGFAICGVAYYYFAPKPDCHLNIALITLTLILTLGCSVISMLPVVEHGSLLPSAIITAFAAYTTLSALASEDVEECNSLNDNFNDRSNSQLVIGALFTLGGIGYSVYKAGSNSKSLLFDDSDDEPDEESDSNGYSKIRDTDGNEIEDGPIQYNYSYFHGIFAVGVMYFSMLLTAWGSLTSDTEEGHGWATVWVKIASVWLTCGLYLWILIAPLAMPGRDFS